MELGSKLEFIPFPSFCFNVAGGDLSSVSVLNVAQTGTYTLYIFFTGS